jgi:hypothetical protein
MQLWEQYPETPGAKPVEVDVLVVVDGTLYLCEAKTSAALDPSQVDRLLNAASRIRPDVLLISCMEPATAALRTAVNTLQTGLGPDIRVDLLEFEADELDDNSMLPC